MDDDTPRWMRWVRAVWWALALLTLLRMAEGGAGLFWLLLVSAGVVALVWRAAGALVRHLFRP